MYLRRQEGRVGARASTGPINAAIAGYEAAASRDPDSVEARWKLMRAFYFKGNFTGLDDDSKKAVFEKAKRVGDEAVAILEKSLEDKGIKGILEFGPEALAGALKDRSDSAPAYFWAAACWGQWAITQGKLEAVRMGAADKIRSYGLTVIGIDPDFEDGGGYRVVGRLNDQAPVDPVHHRLGLAGRGAQVPPARDEGRRRATSLTATSWPRRSTTAATRRTRPRPWRSKRRSWPTRRRPSASSRSFRCRSWRARTSRPGRKLRSPGPRRQAPQQLAPP